MRRKRKSAVQIGQELAVQEPKVKKSELKQDVTSRAKSTRKSPRLSTLNEPSRVKKRASIKKAKLIKKGVKKNIKTRAAEKKEEVSVNKVGGCAEVRSHDRDTVMSRNRKSAFQIVQELADAEAKAYKSGSKQDVTSSAKSPLKNPPKFSPKEFSSVKRRTSDKKVKRLKKSNKKGLSTKGTVKRDDQEVDEDPDDDEVRGCDDEEVRGHVDGELREHGGGVVRDHDDDMVTGYNDQSRVENMPPDSRSHAMTDDSEVQIQDDGDGGRFESWSEDAVNTTQDSSFSAEANEYMDEDQSLEAVQSVRRLSGDHGVLIHMKAPGDFTFQGKALVRCLYGSADIIGYTITDRDRNFYPTYSSEAWRHITVAALPCPSHQTANKSDATLRTFLSSENRILQQILEELESDSCVLVLKKLDDKVCNDVMSIAPYTKLFTQGSDAGVRRTDFRVLRNIGVHLTVMSEKKIFVSDSHWDVISSFCKAAQDTGSKPPVLIVCGGRNTGKSSLNRLILNSALNVCSEIGHLECDLGQTEFTSSGFVSFTVVDQPLLGPPFTHQRVPESMCYVGAPSPSSEPGLYIKCIQHVYKAYSRRSKRIPLVVNTMGWVEGLGLELLVDIIRIIRPCFVVQLDSLNPNKNLPALTPQFVREANGWDVNPSKERVPQHSLYIIETVVQRTNEKSIQYTAKDHRTLTLLARLCGDSGQPLSDLWKSTPYSVPWESVYVTVCHAQVPRKHIMYAVNASVVALCIVDEKKVQGSVIKGCPKFLDDFPVCECIGLGLIRSMDPTEKMFYINTAVDEKELSRVNCLMRGVEELPTQLLFKQTSKTYVPYVGNPKDVTGATSVHCHRYKQRRRTQGQ